MIVIPSKLLIPISLTIALAMVPMKLSAAEQPFQKRGPPPARGEHLVTIGKGLFIGGLAGIGTAIAVANLGKADDGVHPNPIILAGGLIGTAAILVSPFVYFPGKSRERDYRLWKQGKFRVANNTVKRKVTDEEQKEEENDDLTKSISGESELNRVGKQFGLHFNAFGSDGGDGNSMGFIVSNFLTSHSLLELNVASSQDKSFRDKDLESRLIHQLATLRLTQFYGNSFFVSYGLGVRRFQGSLNFTEKKLVIVGDAGEWRTNNYEFYKVKQQDMGVEIALGNRWQWQNFSMGIDWIGLYVPVYKFVADRQREANPSTADTKNTNEAVENLDFKQRWGTQLLRFHLGSTF